MLFSGPILPKLHALDSRTQSSTRPTMAIRNFPFKLGSVARFAFGMDAVGRGLLPSATFIAAQALSSELRSSGTIKGATWTSFVANHGCAKQKVRLLHPRVHTESDVDVICRRLSRHLARLKRDPSCIRVNRRDLYNVLLHFLFNAVRSMGADGPKSQAAPKVWMLEMGEHSLTIHSQGGRLAGPFGVDTRRHRMDDEFLAQARRRGNSAVQTARLP